MSGTLTFSSIVSIIALLGAAALLPSAFAGHEPGEKSPSLELSEFGPRTFKTGDTIAVWGRVGGPLEIYEQPEVKVKLYNPMGTLVKTEIIEVHPTMTSEFVFNYVLDGKEDRYDGEYRVMAWFDRTIARHPEKIRAETTLNFESMEFDSQRFRSFTAESGGKTYEIKYKGEFMDLTEIVVDPVTSSMVIRVTPYNSPNSELIIRYPNELFPYDVTKVIAGSNPRDFRIKQTQKTTELKLQVNPYADTKLFSAESGSEYLKHTDATWFDVKLTDLKVHQPDNRSTSPSTETFMIVAELTNMNCCTQSYSLEVEVIDMKSRKIVLEKTVAGKLNPEGFTQVEQVVVPWISGDNPDGRYEVRAIAYSDPETMKVHTDMRFVPVQLGDPSYSHAVPEDRQYDIVITNFSVKDTEGSKMSLCTGCIPPNSLLMLSTEVKNPNSMVEPFVVYFEVRDVATGLTLFNEFGIGTIEGYNLAEIAVSWTPSLAGRYELRSFVVNDLQDPRKFSPIETMALRVV